MYTLCVQVISGVLVLALVSGVSSQTSAPLQLGARDVCIPNHPVVQCHCWSVIQGDINYDCSQKQLTSIPETYSDQAVSLTFTENSITTITVGSFNHLQKLIKLEFIRNQVDTIESGAFDKMMNLKELYLNDNSLTAIDEDMFRHLPSLEILDLSNNQIKTVHRFSFFTAPSLTNVNMAGNRLSCDCEERLLKLFMTYAKNKNFFKNADCHNLNTPFSSLALNEFPECNNGETVFPPTGSRYCYSCQSVSNVKECSTKQQQQCTDQRAVCFNRIEFTNSLMVYGGCSSYLNCLGWELQNKDNCIKNNGHVSCYICYPNSLGNKRDAINLMKTFTMVALLTFDKTMTSDLRDTSSTAYSGFTMNLDVQLYNGIYGTNGSYAVDFNGLSSSPDNKVVAEFYITSSTIWFFSRAKIMEQVLAKLLSSYIQGTQIISVQMTLLGNSPPYCREESTSHADYGTFSWPRTDAGTVATVDCAYQLNSAGQTKTAVRLCDTDSDGSGIWVAPNVRDCPKADDTSRKLQSLAETTVTDTNVEQVSEDTATLSTDWPDFQAPEVGWSVDIVGEIVSTTGASKSESVIDNTLKIISNVLFVEEGTLTESEADSKASSRLVSNIDTLVEQIDVTSGDYEQVTPNVAARVAKTTAADFTGLSMAIQATNTDLHLTDEAISYRKTESPPPSGHSGIVVPQSVFSGMNQRQRAKVSKMSSSVIREPKVFQTIDKPIKKSITLKSNETVNATRTINSNVIGTSVPGVNVKGLKEPVRIFFQHSIKEAVNAECVYWEDSSSSWKSDGCAVNSTNEGATVCQCNHLTNFALLMDVYGTGGSLTDADKLALAIISYIGCAISLVAICLTLFTYLMFKKLRRDNPSKILMNLCLAIGLVDLVFVVGMQGYTAGSTGACKIVAILLHYFLLAAIFWMAVEAFYMYLALVKVFDTYIARFQLKSSLFGWGIPLVIVAITIGVNKSDNYGVQPGSICWLDRIPFYAAFLAPVCLILILNTISFILVLRQISRRSSSKLTKTDNSNTAVRLRGAVSLVVLLGLTWLFGILAVDNFGIVFHYLFAIFNSLQGFFIFIFYCCLKKEAQQCWRRKLPCLRSVYEDKTTSGTNKDYTALKMKGKNAKNATESRTYEEDFSRTYGQTNHSESDVSYVPPTEDSRTDSTDLARSRNSDSSPTKKETKFRGNWQINA